MKSSTLRKTLVSLLAFVVAGNLLFSNNAKADADKIELANDLSADLLINTDTATDVVTLAKADKFSVTGTLDVKLIKGQMCCFEQKFLGSGAECDPNTCTNNQMLAAMYGKIQLSNAKSDFTATLTLPEGLEFASDASATLSGATDLFEIPANGTSFKGKVATVKMQLKGTYATYADLKTAVNAVNNDLQVKVEGVKFADSAEADKPYVITGAVAGSFSAHAGMMGTEKDFALTWTGKQAADKAYKAQASDIAAAVKFVASEQPEQPEQPQPDKPQVDKPIVVIPSPEAEEIIDLIPKTVVPKMQVAKTGELPAIANVGLLSLLVAGLYVAKKH